MPHRPRRLSLTPDHIARVHRVVADGGPAPGQAQQTEADYAGWVARLMADHPAPGGPTELFAYGSLIWKPEVPHEGERICTARGWHRSFCFRMARFRGTPDRPGLMMALDRGGQCRGVLYRLPPDDLPGQFDRLFRREFTVKPNNTMPRWIGVETESGRVTALGFTVNRLSPSYAGRLPPDEVADMLAGSCGHWGTGAEYLMNTVAQLEAKGIRDSGLWRLQRMVADRIHAGTARP